MQQLLLSLTDIFTLVSELEKINLTCENIVVEYTYFPAMPESPLDNIEGHCNRVKIKHILNYYKEDILALLPKNVLSLLERICIEDVKQSITQFNNNDKVVFEELHSGYSVQLGEPVN